MARRTVLLVAAILVAALGTVLVTLYVHNLDRNTLAKQQPVDVLIAKKIIPAGTTGAAAAAEGALEKTAIPRDAVASSDVLSDIQSVADLVTNSPIFPGEQILKAKFGKPGASSALTIPDAGTIAVSVSLGAPARVNGFVVPGSHVTVFLTVKNTTTVLLADAKVIAIGSRTLVPSSGQGASTADSDVVTFGVSQADAMKLISAQTSGSLYLGLLDSDEADAAASAPASAPASPTS
jgi:pilus assembly protein CpaB